ncbi:MAG: hypothetical protein MSIBF_00790 [Candidatus Altiarchaeales archaeon IMC4]|nr:MAG: hypothetical protein MSIBF_00790 [Candidatus Altiarchaeales archaeon IMC4]
MVIAPKNFRDEELITPKEVFESAGFNVMIAGVSKTKAVGAGSTAVIPDVAIKDAKAEDYDAVVFIGGPGAKEHLWDNKDAHALAKGGAKAKALGSICLAGVVLARSGVLKGREATVFESEETIKEFESAGAEYVKKPVVVSGNIITANGPEAAKAFGAKIVDIVNK